MTAFDKRFSECYKKTAPSLLRYISKCIHDWDAAEEIVQEIFFYLYRKNESFDYDERAFVSFLFRIARCRISDYRKKQKRKPVVFGCVDESPDNSASSGIESNLIAKDLLEKVALLMRSKTKTEQEICLRTFRDGHAIRKISSDLAVSEYKVVSVRRKFTTVVREKIGSLYQ